ncbi:hypothetical protein N7457_008844 [Penicillium paradoxum]|uniref:uncharacterized protein n=1 Tax=Penicillium paradoxum TaxID=176176 RepID=UPI002546E3C4|nr:uncharacterized protein N7457_008844 [Penicillium paradoxum]KAJ5773948.1 hypothetical protein N7457_008844 [Penicillium paradoxum]
MASITKLPAEILCSIIQYLDPAGLISISQTNVHLRSVIQPTKLDFCERLLFLESQQEGGPTPVYNARSNELQPAWSEVEWQSMLWACSDCLRMLPHTAFDNHRILGLGYRKPVPGSSAVTKFTTWQPGTAGRDSATEYVWRERHNPGFEDEIQAVQKRYRVAITHLQSRRRLNEDSTPRLERFQECGMAAFEHMTLEEFVQLLDDEESDLLSQEASRIELAYCGFKRHQRQCNECRYQRGELLSCRDGIGGSPTTPVTRSRRVWYESQVDRYFPGLAITLDIKNARGQSNFAVYPGDTDFGNHWWTMYMVRCSGCSTWKEAHSFPLLEQNWYWRPSRTCLHPTDLTDEAILVGERANEELGKWDRTPADGEIFGKLLCSHCFSRENGREPLETGILGCLKNLLHYQKCYVATGLFDLFQRIRDDSFSCPPKWRSEIYDITDPPRESIKTNTAMCLASYKKWIMFLQRTKNAGRHRNWHGVEGPFDDKQRDYEERMEHYTCMKAIYLGMKEREKVEKLVEWALNDSVSLL